jgi:hypothetical protein
MAARPVERRRWRRALEHNFAPGEKVVAYAEVKPADGATTLPMVATQFALYQPGVSPDVRIAYEHIESATFQPRSALGDGLLTLRLPGIGELAYECRDAVLAPYVVSRVTALHR